MFKPFLNEKMNVTAVDGTTNYQKKNKEEQQKEGTCFFRGRLSA